MHFWSFWAKYGLFRPFLSHARPKNNTNKVPRCFFRYEGTKTFAFSSKKFGSKLVILVILGQAGLANLVPCWWVGWWFCPAGCISQDPYLLYFYQELILGHPVYKICLMLLKTLYYYVSRLEPASESPVSTNCLTPSSTR